MKNKYNVFSFDNIKYEKKKKKKKNEWKIWFQ